MPDFTLPGTVPGLLRCCSRIVVTYGPQRGRYGVVVEFFGDDYAIVALQETETRAASVKVLALEDIALNLSDPTGLVHAFWWLVALPNKVVADTLPVLGLDRPEFGDLLSRVFTGAELTDADRAEFHRLCAHLTGVSDE